MKRSGIERGPRRGDAELASTFETVAPAYVEQRRSRAKQIGLGRKKIVEEVTTVAKAVKRGAAKAVETATCASEKTIRKPYAKKAAAAMI